MSLRKSQLPGKSSPFNTSPRRCTGSTVVARTERNDKLVAHTHLVQLTFKLSKIHFLVEKVSSLLKFNKPNILKS
jgi:hypothetical protein